MDYKTKPLSRKTIRSLAELFREVFDVAPEGVFPVLEALEKVPTLFPNSSYLVVPDDDLPIQVPARCVRNPGDERGFTIEIKEHVYKGAYESNVGAYRDHICHEICHVFLFDLGYTPIVERCFKDRALPNYESVEWQAKALCGEVMIPFEASIGLSAEEIEEQYMVSSLQADYRVNHVK